MALTQADIDFLDRSLRLTLEGIQGRLDGGRRMLGLSSLPEPAKAVLAEELAAYEALEALAVDALQAEDRREGLERTAALIEAIIAMRKTALGGTVH